MDPDHRHELKENDLAVFLANFSQWWARHGFKTLIGILLAAAIISAVLIVGQLSRRDHEQTWSELATTSKAEVFQRRADAYDDPVARALANLRGAALYNARATLPGGTPVGSGAQPDGVSNNADRQAYLNHAEDMLQQVRQDPNVPELFKLNAMIILAAVQENRGNFDKAAAIYQEVQTGAGEFSSAILHRADHRLALLEKLHTPLAFGPDEPTDASTDPTNQSADQVATPISPPTDGLAPDDVAPQSSGADQTPDSSFDTSVEP